MNNFMKRLYLGILLLFLYAPIVVLIIFSFNESKSRGHWGGFTLDWYIQLFRDRSIMNALWNTIAIAALSSVTATIIGTAAAIGINAMRRLTRRIVLALNNLPVLNPDIVTGVSLMILFVFIFNLIPLQMGFITLLLAHITFNIPYVILSVLPKLRQLDPNLYEAALDLGASPGLAFRKVIFPEIWPGIFTGLILAFTLSIDDFIVSFFTTGSGVSNLSIVIFSMARKGVNPKINALSTIIFIIVMLLLFLVNKRDRKELKNI